MKTEAGSIAWHDLTVPDARRIRDFYAAVLGWRAEPIDMGGYDDFDMLPAEGDEVVAGICHARGGSANLPPVWLIYFVVDDIERSIAQCMKRGGELIAPIRFKGNGRFCVIRDPAGAVAALYQETVRS